jgi:hypothetical protein
LLKMQPAFLAHLAKGMQKLVVFFAFFIKRFLRKVRKNRNKKERPIADISCIYIRQKTVSKRGKKKGI